MARPLAAIRALSFLSALTLDKDIQSIETSVIYPPEYLGEANRGYLLTQVLKTAMMMELGNTLVNLQYW